jgi:DNA-directed RNA polymerase beta' subunit
MGTARSGYIQRRIIKLTEDIKINYDGTVRDATGKIYQLAYGDDNLDPLHTVKVKEDLEVCDVSRILDKLNMEHEVKVEETKKVSKFKKDKMKK